MLRSVLLAVLACLVAGVQAATPAVSAGGTHSLALHRDGTLRAWGDDTSGALGIGRSLGSPVPIPVPALPPVAFVAAGESHSVAVTTDGRVFAWGNNIEGELGDGSRIGRSSAVPVNITGVVEVAAGRFHTLARRSDGTVWSWGANYSGALGDDSAVRTEPAQVPGLANVIAIAAGGDHSVALTSDGRVWTWGLNEHGRLGNGIVPTTWDVRTTPTPVVGLSGITAIASTHAHTLALRQDGTVWAWGYNEYGSLGDGTTISRGTPVAVQGLTGVVSIAAGSYSAAIRADGTVWAWGSNGYGNLGDGTFIDRLVPVSIGLSNVVRMSVSFIHSVAVKADGTVWAWGNNAYGEVGDGTTERRVMPVQIGGVTGAVQLATGGGGHSLAVLPDNTVRAWGSDSSGQLGIGTRIFRTTEVRPVNGTDFIAISAGSRHSLALKSDGRVFAVGENGSNQLGDGTQVSRATLGPVRATLEPLSDLTGVVEIAAGGSHSLARKSDGTVWAWGSDYEGRLGNDGEFNSSNLPVRVASLANVVRISASDSHSLAVRADGTVWAWGANVFGQIGDGTTQERFVPVQVSGLTNVVEVSAGAEHSLARRSDGSVWAWGRNYHGQLGDDTTVDRLTPVRVNGLVNVTMIAAGNSMSAARTADGGVWTWGANYEGQLGGGTSDERFIPYRLAISDVASVSVGQGHMLGLRTDGAVFSWGFNEFGQLGDATLANRTTPVIVARENGAGSVAGNDWFLDLDPQAPNDIPAERTPVFLVNTSGSNTNVNAQVQFRAQDVGTSASVYVFALAPASMVQGAVMQKDKRFGAFEKGEKDTAACVLAQLNASGQLRAVSTSSLQAYVTGVLSGQGQAVQVLNGVPTATIGGATFYVGYGSSPQTMLGNGTNRSVVSVPGATNCQPEAPATGWWWNAQEGGRGYSIEVRGNHIFYAAYLYDVSGRASWLVATGVTSLDGSLFAGELFGFNGGQTLGGPYTSYPASRSEGAITLAFNDASHGTMIWPGGTVPIERFNIVPNGLEQPPRENQPESGWWWNPAESGRGFFLEWQGGQLFMAGYMYDDQGNPLWYLSGNSTPSANLQGYSNNWLQFGNGQTLTGAYRAPTQVNGNVAPVTIQFSGPETGIMTLPNGRTTAIRRFRF